MPAAIGGYNAEIVVELVELYQLRFGENGLDRIGIRYKHTWNAAGHAVHRGPEYLRIQRRCFFTLSAAQGW